MMPLPPIRLPFWMGGEQASKLAAAAQVWFSRLGEVATWPARQLDPFTATLAVLDLMAWQRNITRYPGEPERLYRLRVAHAYANACDAGSVAGWKRIFRRLELGDVGLEERVPGQPWDVIGVVVDDASFPDRQNVLEIIVDEYGRTCRRYRFISRITKAVRVTACAFDDDHLTVSACSAAIPGVRLPVRAATFDNEHHTTEAIA